MVIHGDVYEQAESPIEHYFWHGMEKHFRGDDAWAQSCVCGGKYRLDAVFTHRSYKVAVELDGARFHNEDDDKKRDAEILRAREVHEIVRITGRAITYAQYACFAVLEDWYPFTFRVPEMAYFEFEDAIALGEFWQEIVGERQMYRRGTYSASVSQGPKKSDWKTFVGHEVRRRIGQREA
jgi:very-short-patch-repair endonuclease